MSSWEAWIRKSTALIEQQRLRETRGAAYRVPVTPVADCNHQAERRMEDLSPGETVRHTYWACRDCGERM